MKSKVVMIMLAVAAIAMLSGCGIGFHGGYIGSGHGGHSSGWSSGHGHR